MMFFPFALLVNLEKSIFRLFLLSGEEINHQSTCEDVLSSHFNGFVMWTQCINYGLAHRQNILYWEENSKVTFKFPLLKGSQEDGVTNQILMRTFYNSLHFFLRIQPQSAIWNMKNSIFSCHLLPLCFPFSASIKSQGQFLNRGYQEKIILPLVIDGV